MKRRQSYTDNSLMIAAGKIKAPEQEEESNDNKETTEENNNNGTPTTTLPVEEIKK